jgi:hypothetical protein
MAKYLGVDETRALGLAKQIFKKVDMNNSGSIDFSCNSGLIKSSSSVPATSRLLLVRKIWMWLSTISIRIRVAGLVSNKSAKN